MPRWVIDGLAGAQEDTGTLVTADGTRYPSGFPRGQIPGAHPVIETPAPTEGVITACRVEFSDGAYRTVWETRQPTPEEVAATEARALAAAWQELRNQRNRLLASTDYMVLRQVEQAYLSPDAHVSLLFYRQALRDLPANTADPRAPIWPIPPG